MTPDNHAPKARGVNNHEIIFEQRDPLRQRGRIPAVVDRATFQTELDALRVQEKAHIREGDAIAAARRRLPMVEVDSTIELTGRTGRSACWTSSSAVGQLIAYYFMWYPGRPAAEQCEGCTCYTTQIGDLSYLHDRDITYATLCQGPYVKSVATAISWAGPCRGTQPKGRLTRCWSGAGSGCFTWGATNCGTATGRSRRTGPRGRGVEAMDNNYALMDLTVYGRQEPWEDSPARLAAAMLQRADQRRVTRLATSNGVAGRTPHRPVAAARSWTL